MMKKWILPSSTSESILETLENCTYIQTYNKNLKYSSISVNFLGGDILEKILGLRRGYLHLFEHIIMMMYKNYVQNNLLEGDLNNPSIRLGCYTWHTYLSIQLYTYYTNTENAIKVLEKILEFDVDEKTFDEIKNIEIKRIVTELNTQNREYREKLIMFATILKDTKINIAEDMVVGQEEDLRKFSYSDFLEIKKILVNKSPKTLTLQSNEDFNSRLSLRLKQTLKDFKQDEKFKLKANEYLIELKLDNIRNKIYEFKSFQNKFSVAFINSYPLDLDYKKMFSYIAKNVLLTEILTSFLKQHNLGNYAVQKDSTNIYYKYEISLFNISNSVLSDEETRNLLELKLFDNTQFAQTWSKDKDLEKKFMKFKSSYIFNSDSTIDPLYTNGLTYPILLGHNAFNDSLMNHLEYIKDVKLSSVLLDLQKDLQTSKRIYIKTVK